MTSHKLRQLIDFIRFTLVQTGYKEDNWNNYRDLMDFLNLQYYILVEKEKKTAALLREKNGTE